MRSLSVILSPSFSIQSKVNVTNHNCISNTIYNTSHTVQRPYRSIFSSPCLSGCRSSASLPGRSWTPGETPPWKWTFAQRKVTAAMPVCKYQRKRNNIMFTTMVSAHINHIRNLPKSIKKTWQRNSICAVIVNCF